MKKYGLWWVALWSALTAVAQTPQEVQPSLTTPQRIEVSVNGQRLRLYSVTQYDSLIVVPHFGVKIYYKDRPSVDILNATYRLLADDEEIAPTDGKNINKNTNLQGTRRYAGRLEYPRTRDDENNLIVVHELPEPQGVSFSLEWDCQLKAQRWTCYQFHDGFAAHVTRTTGGWNDDPQIPPQYQTHSRDYDENGGVYHRGHMCNSLDRLNSEAQNRQTFFISNAHPQFASHNTGLWRSLEARVNKWGMSSTFRDTLFVVKAGTIDDDRVLPPMKSGKTGTQPVLVPKYMYMAVLCKKDDHYKAMAFWTEHVPNPPSGRPLREYAISIRQLEALTHLDFFCNLPDDIEREVEENFDPSAWEW